MLCIIQSRMNSRRLPGKMLMDINGRPLLGRVVDRVNQTKSISKLIVATSIHKDDDKIVDFCKNENLNFYRGDLKNVFKRFKEIIRVEKVNAFVRINGDSPLIDPDIIDFAINKFNSEKCDILTNVFPRTYPKGQSVEILSSATFNNINEANLTSSQKEHLTKYFYDNSKNFRINNFQLKEDYSHINLCVDTIIDLENVRKIFLEKGSFSKSWKLICNEYK